MRRIAVVASWVCGIALLLVGCHPGTTEQGAGTGRGAVPTGAPTLAELKTATYGGLDEPAALVTLEDGRWEGAPFVPGGASRPSVSLAPDFRVTGDLDGEGADEAVVVLAQSSGGSGTFNYLAVVKRTAAGLDNVATVGLGDRVQLRSARIENRRLLVSVVRAGESDAMCCPGELADLAWTLLGGTLEPTAPTGPTGRLSLDILAGTEWVLRAWDRDQPAPAAPEVTLAYQDGRFAGGSGCNRYTAAAKAGDQPGDLSVGPAAGTRMACPEHESAVETRFLTQLGAARKFGFLLGRLALTYQRPDGGVGTMVFDERPGGTPTSP